MESTISATTLARQLGDILGRVRYRGEAFVIERNGTAIARLGPAGGKTSRATWHSAIRDWRDAAPPEPEFADDLSRIGAADSAPDNPWGS
jgi:antitoxin (DNA-binding transcriptional repressor) of toxin-antitoxin stability system